jgi:hypothetical protein
MQLYSKDVDAIELSQSYTQTIYVMVILIRGLAKGRLYFPNFRFQFLVHGNEYMY